MTSAGIAYTALGADQGSFLLRTAPFLPPCPVYLVSATDGGQAAVVRESVDTGSCGTHKLAPRERRVEKALVGALYYSIVAEWS